MTVWLFEVKNVFWLCVLILTRFDLLPALHREGINRINDFIPYHALMIFLRALI